MPPKNPVNGFAIFMWEMKERRRLNMSGANLAGFCGPLWTQLPANEKKLYDQRAKELKKQKRTADGDMTRRDNIGNIIGTRKNPEEERRKRRLRDQDLVTREWAGKDLTEERFYFVNFQDMCELTESDNNTDREWLPREVALVEFSLRHGITQHYHAFINPGPIPKGFRFTCMQNSEDTHKIPVEDFELDSTNYAMIWRNMKEMLRDGVRDGVYPPLFCLDADHEKMKYLLDWMWYQSGDCEQGDNNPLGRVYAIEDLVVNLLAYSNQPNTEAVSCAGVVSKLDGSHWDFISNTSCDWHEEQETKHCALGIVRRYGFTISDILAQVYNIQLTDKHVPMRSSSEKMARVLPPESMPGITNQQRMRSKGRARGRLGSSGDSSRRKPRGGRQGLHGRPEEEAADQFFGEDVSHLYTRSQLAPEAEERTFFGPKFGRPFGYQEVPVGPGSGQFDDWPELGGGGVEDVSGGKAPRRTAGDDPLSQMSALSLSSASSAWLKGSAGRGTTTDLDSVSSGQRPPPGLVNTAFGPVPDSAPKVGRGHPRQQDPSGACNTAPLMGRGLVSVGRGAPPATTRDLPGMRGAQVPVTPGSQAFSHTPGDGGAAAPVGRGAPPSVGRGVAAAMGRGFPGMDVNRDVVSVPGFAAPGRTVSAGDSAENYEPPFLGEAATSGGRGVAPHMGRGMTVPVGGPYRPTVGRGLAGGGMPVGRGFPGL